MFRGASRRSRGQRRAPAAPAFFFSLPPRAARPGSLSHRVLRHVSHALDWLGEQVVLFRFGNVLFVSFGFFAALGVLVSAAYMGAVLSAQGIAPWVFLQLAVTTSAAIVVGSWLAGQLLDYRLLWSDPRRALCRPVFVSWGGLLGLVIALAGFSLVSGSSLRLLLDAAARAAPLGHALGRLGCLSYGCCFGKPTHLPMAITYRNASAKAVRVGKLAGVPLHPAALYEAVLELGVLVAANAVAALGAPLGLPTALALLLYGGGRFALEFLRDNTGRYVIGAVTVNHLIALLLLLTGALALPAAGLLSAPTPCLPPFTLPGTLPRFFPAVLPAALVVFLAFSVHRERVGQW